MNPIASCPGCARSLGRFEADGRFRATCFNCRLKVEGFWGRLSHWHSKGEPLLYLHPQLPKLFRRRYEFRIATPGRELKLLKFTTPGLVDQVPARPGDRIGILYSGSADHLEKLMAIQNYSLGQTFRPSAAIPSTAHLWKVRGGMSAALGISALIGGVNLGIITAAAVAISLLSRIDSAAELSSPPLRRDRPDEVRLMAELKLVQQKADLQYHSEVLKQEIQEHRELIKRFQTLRSKMMAHNASLYAPRVSRLEGAIQLLKQRINHTQQLIEGYQQTTQMLDIELEAASLADRLPNADDFTRQVLKRVEELRAIEAEQQAAWQRVQSRSDFYRLVQGT
ncbi:MULTISPECIES: hypothetical protein [unclassified Leptolyngbya]|uniref:hypothetical protein n=1 Tax=unclassified Leptolyngbya TaxID=2650499 RepID=UPI001684C095|nr:MULTISPECIES: hypothetical protein [unclassified Leptolyngbya]MBD1912128.1 hypothetical protein [Leptolyngbya sp. FACHB-8]MBD2155019.1 hypothetical protein [Leptolyngbya sp. FACHB-16]